MQFLSDSLGFFRIPSDSFRFPQILSDSFKIFQILSDFFRFFQILSDSDHCALCASSRSLMAYKLSKAGVKVANPSPDARRRLPLVHFHLLATLLISNQVSGYFRNRSKDEAPTGQEPTIT